jgi:predicted O-methyltransferase YrrM
MSKSARGDRIFPLFNHNVKWSGHSDVIIPVRTFSQVAARFFREKQFDIVFIDGDHTYNSVSFDIQNYAPLVKDDGYICGDDLEIQANQVNESFTREHLEDDVVCDPTTGIYFHPSITVAVGEYFGEVSVYAGFWVMQKWANNWRKVDIH